jgi:anthranilate phosphoribosyltransferase
MSREHPFAHYIRTLGKGRKGQRSLSREEARAAMGDILSGRVTPEQLGAFLMLMRVKEETPAEVAGFAEAVRDSLDLPEALPRVDVDWSSYAGKRRQLPWYLLAALLLARKGVRVFMHGLSREDGRIYTPQALAALGLGTCSDLGEAARELETSGFAYLPLQRFAPELERMIGMRDILGLRSPVNTVARMVNPFAARLLMQGIFHPGYAPVHQQAAWLLGIGQAVVIKGEAGEIERDPHRAVTARNVVDGEMVEEEWPALFEAGRHAKPRTLDLHHFRAVWEGRAHDEYGEAAVTATVALVLKALGHADSQGQALELARDWWRARH